ncbi:MAG: enoyl-CoA hydratase/isomerase family protein [Gammaproteobacteria bacterium]|nr:enoyl-CoA hydratase/isomerase family protein [Gammaproteobacteria bacterium]
MNQNYECFQISVTDQVAHLQLSRPEKANSLNLSFWREFPQAIQNLNKTGQIRALIISGQGKVFCGGLDLEMFTNQSEFHAANAIDREGIIQSLGLMQDALTCLEKVRFPIIAAVHGSCVGAGFDLIAACDFCFVTHQAKFRIEETNIGMMADIGVLQRLPHQIPFNVARYLALTGDTLTAEDAYRLGLAVKVLETPEALLEHAFSVARKIASKPPVAMQGIKRSLIYSRDHDVAQALDHTVMLQSAILNGQDILKMVQSRMSGQAAQFDDLKQINFADA